MITGFRLFEFRQTFFSKNHLWTLFWTSKFQKHFLDNYRRTFFYNITYQWTLFLLISFGLRNEKRLIVPSKAQEYPSFQGYISMIYPIKLNFMKKRNKKAGQVNITTVCVHKICWLCNALKMLVVTRLAWTMGFNVTRSCNRCEWMLMDLCPNWVRR